MTHDVFISYSSVDQSTADSVCVALEDAHVSCWIAPRDVVAGTRYAEAIVDSIRESRIFLLVFSTAAMASVQVERETDRAVAFGLPILPFRIEDVPPGEALEYYLAGQHWFDAFAPSPGVHLGRLAGTIRTLLAAPETTGRTRTGPPATSRPARQERRVVTALACDMVGFAAACDHADPEDVASMLQRYMSLVAGIAEAHGGVITQSVGDSVIVAFGVPAVHEDDPERAVCAGLSIAERAAELVGPNAEPLRIRVGIDTGEALVRLGVKSGPGDSSVMGDIAGRAAQLRSGVPSGGVVVSAATHALASPAIDYEALDPLSLESQGEPFPMWRAKAIRPRSAVQLAGEHLTPLVGRKDELAHLTALFETAAGSSSPEITLIIGEPGVGKSRLVAELIAFVEARPERVTWRQGRCLPYGEGVTYWALAEIVKAQAGIKETDDSAMAEAKLEAIVSEGSDRTWMRNRLRALLGMEAPQASREENYAAWLRFLEDLAASDPAVLVFEDLHWADESLLAFLDFFASNVGDVPLLVVGTARPELLEKHPLFAASAGWVDRIALKPLTKEETECLVSGLVEANSVPEGMVDQIIERSEGNPFFAEETVHLLRERVRRGVGAASLVATAAGGAAAEAAPLPESVQAVIAARLDTLFPEHKAMLADAAVIGQVFWSGAIAGLGKRGGSEVDEGLRDLVAKHLVRRVRNSSMANENEFSFCHALARDVAYHQLPRIDRANRHAAAAAWIQSKAGERVGDLAEVLCHHYEAALDLARAAGERDLGDSLVGPAVRYLALAGDRLINVEVGAAERRYARALEIAGAENPEYPRLLTKWARALAWAGRFGDATDALEEAIPCLRAAGDIRTAATAMMKLSEVRMTLGDPGTYDLGLEAVALLDGDGPSSELAEVLCIQAFGLLIMKADEAAAIEMLGQSMAISDQLGLPESVMALNARGCARCNLGDLGGLDDLKHAFDVADAQGLGAELALLHNNYAGTLWVISGPQACSDAIAQGLEFALRRGIDQYVLNLRAAHIGARAALGEWVAALAQAAELVPVLEEAGDTFSLLIVRPWEALLLVRRGEERRAKPLLAWLEENGRQSEISGAGGPCLMAASAVRFRLGEVDAALGLLAECATMHHVAGSPCDEEAVLEAIRTALAAGDRALAESLVEGVQPRLPLEEIVVASAAALLVEHRGQHAAAASGFADAASRWHDFGEPYEEAQALLGRGRCLVALDRATEAAPALAEARAVFARLGARPALAETDALLAQAGGTPSPRNGAPQAS